DVFDARVIDMGTPLDDELFGSPLDDLLSGQDGADRLVGRGGNDILDGGPGFDTAEFSGPRSAYSITVLPGGAFRISGPDGTDTLTNIERFVFDDQAVLATQFLNFNSAQFADFDGNGRSELLFINSAGVIGVWQTNSSGVLQTVTALGSTSPDW